MSDDLETLHAEWTAARDETAAFTAERVEEAVNIWLPDGTVPDPDRRTHD